MITGTEKELLLRRLEQIRYLKKEIYFKSILRKLEAEEEEIKIKLGL